MRYKVHKIEDIDTLESELNEMIIEIGRQKVSDVRFEKILDSDVVIIEYMTDIELEESERRIATIMDEMKEEGWP